MADRAPGPEGVSGIGTTDILSFGDLHRCPVCVVLQRLRLLAGDHAYGRERLTTPSGR